MPNRPVGGISACSLRVAGQIVDLRVPNPPTYWRLKHRGAGVSPLGVGRFVPLTAGSTVLSVADMAAGKVARNGGSATSQTRSVPTRA
jgi:hypothetical protein